MHTGRLEAFSDGVLAIIITIMVLEIKVPHGSDLNDLMPLIPVFFSYILSFIYIGIYWNNHHHMMFTLRYVTGGILWANLHLLFWLSLIPFVTGWMGENNFAQKPIVLYGFVLLMAAIAYYILQNLIIKSQGKDSILAKAIGKDFKGKFSPILYIAGILLSWITVWASEALFILSAIIWLIPDKRIESILKSNNKPVANNRE